MEKVKLKHVAIKNLGVVREGSRGHWVKVQIGRLGMTERDNLTNIIAKTATYNSPKNIGGTIECVIWVRCDKSFVSAGDVFYGDVEFSCPDDITQAIELDSFTTDVAAAYSWEFPGDREMATDLPLDGSKSETFALLSVAIKIVDVVRSHDGMYICKIQVGRMSEKERRELESFLIVMSADHCHLQRTPIRMVKGGKTVPGTIEPLYTYEMYVRMATRPRPAEVVDRCDLKFKYVAEKGMILAGVIDVDAPSGWSTASLRGLNWFNVQMEDQGEDAVKPLVSFRNGSHMHVTKAVQVPEIEKIEFNEPATIIFWKDGTKTVVQSRDGEPYDAEKGIAMAIAKKALGNERDYYHLFLHWIKRYKKKGGSVNE
ncbi:MAG: hypothetical protein J6U31_07100 [Bacteroidales bacterium]|nr:hypothetical protein [Bacteroidales bacterium]